MSRSLILGMALTTVSLLAIGCGEKYVVNLQYTRPAEYTLPEDVRRVAVTEFSGSDQRDRRWGQRAADRLVAKLDEYGRQLHGYEIVDRNAVDKILKERDLQLFAGDAAAAQKIGQIARADALIYGTADVSSERVTKTVPRLSLSGRAEREQVEVLTATATLSFQMVRVRDGQSLAPTQVTRKYPDDVKKDDGGNLGFVRGMVGGGGDDGVSDEQVMADLVDLCVDAFVARISPHRVSVEAPLEKGKEKDLVERGNQMAVRGDYKDALDLYLQALDLKGDDHGTLYNAAVMYEALGQFDQALQHYNRAYALKAQDKYLDGRNRVREEALRGR